MLKHYQLLRIEIVKTTTNRKDDSKGDGELYNSVVFVTFNIGWPAPFCIICPRMHNLSLSVQQTYNQPLNKGHSFHKYLKSIN